MTIHACRSVDQRNSDDDDNGTVASTSTADTTGHASSTENASPPGDAASNAPNDRLDVTAVEKGDARPSDDDVTAEISDKTVEETANRSPDAHRAAAVGVARSVSSGAVAASEMDIDNPLGRSASSITRGNREAVTTGAGDTVPPDGKQQWP